MKYRIIRSIRWLKKVKKVLGVRKLKENKKFNKGKIGKEKVIENIYKPFDQTEYNLLLHH